MKPCPFCAEPIQEAAIKCRHCGSMLTDAPRPAASSDAPKRVLFEGVPSWKAYFGSTVLILLGAPAFAVGGFVLTGTQMVDAAMPVRLMAALVPLVLGALAFLLLHLYRRSTRIRVTTRSIETEVGIFSKKIDVLELWRVKDLSYHQSLLERVLGIARIDIYTKDVTTPNLVLPGLPASREIFETLRDSIEIQRQSRRVLGLMD